MRSGFFCACSLNQINRRPRCLLPNCPVKGHAVFNPCSVCCSMLVHASGCGAPMERSRGFGRGPLMQPRKALGVARCQLRSRDTAIQLQSTHLLQADHRTVLSLVRVRWRTVANLPANACQLSKMGDQANSSMPQWKGLFDWSMSYHDGTRATDFDDVGKPDPEKIKWCVPSHKKFNSNNSLWVFDRQ